MSNPTELEDTGFVNEYGKPCCSQDQRSSRAVDEEVVHPSAPTGSSKA
jgi:hypothetical protein